MKTDSLFYRIFQSVPGLFFELIGQPSRQGYQFKSIEVKQTAFRIDGVFLPPANAPDSTVFFVEVQFQEDELIYHRLFAELFVFLQQNPQYTHWQAVVIFPRKSLEPEDVGLYSLLLESDQVQRFYLNELEQMQPFSVAIGLMQLIVASKKRTPVQAKQILAQVDQQSLPFPKAILLELIETTMVYKFPLLSRQEIAEMLGLAESAKHTRVYQEGLETGLKQLLGREQQLVLKQLSRKVGKLPPKLESQVKALPLEPLEELAEALLDFSTLDDLSAWLDNNNPGQ
ncbi:MAG: Rpn family recombination-promoting nuclease/putative transposase [Symploca sp. SIO1B1]|nr:Rpn family recombination-promoting nuclease/putative transposase [Symploca sp. SIO1C2]NES00550.1 Rpn family recombination-promoting nuclease/putative transposase [Symploca sp. SIO1B1]